MEIELLSIGWDTEVSENKYKYQEMSILLKILEESETVIVPTEKPIFLEAQEKKITMVE